LRKRLCFCANWTAWRSSLKIHSPSHTAAGRRHGIHEKQGGRSGDCGGAIVLLGGLWLGMQWFRAGSAGGVGASGEVEQAVRGRPADLSQLPLVYHGDFGQGVDEGWSDRQTETSPGGQVMLGQFADDAAELSLVKLPPHEWVRLSFDLYFINSWDGCGRVQDRAEWKIDGPDFFTLDRVDGPALMRTSFSNITQNWNRYASWQTYPSPIPSPANPMGAGAAAINTLGYLFHFPGSDRPYPLDSTYAISVIFPHRQSTLRLRLAGENLQGVFDEGWGLANVKLKRNCGGCGKQRWPPIRWPPVRRSGNWWPAAMRPWL